MREIPGIDALSRAFPAEWLFYASLQCYPPRSYPIEIDALVITGDRALLLELKDYNGHLTANGDQWVLNGRRRGRSAVDTVSDKARKVRGLLNSSVPGFSKYPVDSRVVLTASATKHALTPTEQSSVWSLDEACSIADPARSAMLLGTPTLQIKKAFSFEPEFERITRNARQWCPAEGNWDGYRVIEQDVVVHPRNIWREHRAERSRDPRFKALLRIWSFDHLPPGLNSADHRQRIAEREMRAIGLLHDHGSKLLHEGRILLPTGEEKQEILTQHFELRILPKDWTTLDRFLESNRSDLTPEDRLLSASALLNVLAELHAHGIAHRDIGPRCVWVGEPAKLGLSGFMACQIPGEQSIADWYPTLRGHGPEMPEDTPGAPSGSARQRDVYAAGRLICRILSNNPATSNVADAVASLGSPERFSELKSCLERATASDPTVRYEHAEAMADDFAAILERADGSKVDTSIIDRAETSDIPYVRYPQHTMLEATPRVNVYLHRTVGGEQLVVKLWPGLRRGLNKATDFGLVTLFEGSRRLIAIPVSGLPEVVDLGLSPVGPFVVYRFREGTTLDLVQFRDAEAAVDAAVKLISAVDALHAMDLFHGDLTTRNVLLDAQGGVQLIDLFDLSPIGTGRIRTPDYCPEGWERLTEQQIDRYGATKIVANVLGKIDDERLAATRAILADELQRPAIETLEPAHTALKAAQTKLQEPPPPAFILRAPVLPPGPILSDDGLYFVRVQRPSHDRLLYSVAGVGRELTFQLTDGQPPHRWFSEVTYSSLMHASMRGTPVRCTIELVQGDDGGFDDLLEFLQRSVTAPEPAEPEAGDAPPSAAASLDIPRYWKSLISLEENLQPAVEILRELGSRGGLAAYAYERDTGDFDFDSESTVEVFVHGRKVGEIDLAQTDERALVIRSSGRPLAIGDRAVLVDRRSKASLDRRRKAVDRIIAGEAALPGLISYFSESASPVVDYETRIAEDVLDSYQLNTGQKRAFRHIVRYGPVGLLQGPPGTGKTHFIAALVHWLITQAGAQKILIASQSHEAVNNAIEQLIDLFKGLKRRPNLLRIGSKGITQKIRPYHTSSLREQYRVRFDNAFKHRLLGIGSAIGLNREFVGAAVEIERRLGRPARRIRTLLGAARKIDDMAPEDRRRYDASLRSATNEFLTAGRVLLSREPDLADIDGELTNAFNYLLDQHAEMSPADVAKVRGLIALSIEWLDALASSHRNFEEFLAKTRTIVTATCVGAGQTRIRIDARAYDWVIVDEAARCTPGELAVPLQVARRVLLVGDHRQLRPMLADGILDGLAEANPGMSRNELSCSDFERAYASSFGRDNGQILTEQYRMAPDICDLVSKVYYEPHNVRLTTSPVRKGIANFPDVLPPALQAPITWIDTSLEGNSAERTAEWNRHSFWNPAEVTAVMSVLGRIAESAELVAALLRTGNETPIGIVCMYSAQKVKLEQSFTQHPWESRFKRLVRIDTVDSYQGKENEIVIVSLVRSNPARDAGHVRSPNRANVAFSRAKERLIVVGARTMWKACHRHVSVRTALEFIENHPAAAKIVSARDV